MPSRAHLGPCHHCCEAACDRLPPALPFISQAPHRRCRGRKFLVVVELNDCPLRAVDRDHARSSDCKVVRFSGQEALVQEAAYSLRRITTIKKII
ncbi:hypothetical protein BRADI_4g23511v3 [Brachypodium distachyon]|uniref:Uncharacterized protein n=1 Tax=Brachypodium distachyon TaxID=15368 RepID=A0A0Q3ISF2_BRADI|nr:hypothetical protein BRADI_4g23511v3 [Brachypodium distachyon]KQJ89104.1 hypothetical protein BRADI_4g23511v3 [Brachypodium distachyon]